MPKRKNDTIQLEKDPLWYKNAVIYELHVRAFYDADRNGIGDFAGLTEKLDYLRDLGVTAIWLLPFYPSPLRDDGYDISDYYSIHPNYGTLNDFKVFLREAHRRGLRVITELVVNHTSDQHPWFQKSRRAKPGDPWRDYYVWSDSADKYKETRIIFKDFETSNWTWDPVAGAYFWHRFYSHQPDLNFDNPRVHQEIFKVLDFWFDLGVDGLRLDAVPYLYEREGTSCENLPETHRFLRDLRRHVDENYGDRMLLAEANQWPEDAVSYLGAGKGDECHMAFHFPLMPRLFMAVRMEDRVPIVDILDQTPPIPETAQWALFLRNHDELTLEMVTDEERDYMYRTYASDQRARINLGIRRRLAPLLGNDRKRIELLHGLLLTLPGTPVLYYGDEIGMGENIFLGDRNGVRTPMHWSSDRNAGFSRSNPQSLYLPIIVDPEYHYEAINVEAQLSNQHSLLWWLKRVLALRKRLKAPGHGTIEFLHPENRKILAYIRRHEDETILVVANLSRFVQPVELDLSAFKNLIPVEVFGRTEFPRIGDQPYFLTMGPHSFNWFSLESPRTVSPTDAPLPRTLKALPALTAAGRWESIFQDETRPRLEEILHRYIRARRWFRGKAKAIKAVTIRDLIHLPLKSGDSFIALVGVDYVQGDPEIYVLPLGFTPRKQARALLRDYPHLAICRLNIGGSEPQDGILVDAMGSKEFCSALLESIQRKRGFKGKQGELVPSHTRALRALAIAGESALTPSLLKAEHSNSAVVYGNRLILKLFRKLEEGINLDAEIGRFLTERKFTNVPPMMGLLEYRPARGDASTLAVLNGFVPEAKDAWEYALDSLGRFFDRVQALPPESQQAPPVSASLLEAAAAEPPGAVADLIGTCLESFRLLGKRTAELHIALASERDSDDFAPESFSSHYQRSLYQSMRNMVTQNFQVLRKRLKDLPESAAPLAQKAAAREGEILKRYRSVYDRRLSASRIRCHGDYHLGQVLYTGKDFIILDFEGEPARALSERRIKRSPLRDVAGMLRSFHYAAHMALQIQVEQGAVRADNLERFEAWANLWQSWVGAVYLKAYLETARKGKFLPASEEELKVMLDAYLLDKAMYELGYELNNRPDWVKIPLQGILYLADGGPSS